MSTKLQLKKSLLITHGTVYGEIPADPGHIDYAGISSSISDSWELPWRQELYHVQAPDQLPFGPLTDNAPIDVVSWPGTGELSPSGMEIWQQCLTLFMRHI